MPTGLVSSYDLTVGVKIDIDDLIYTLSPLDSPFINGTDADGLSILSSAPVSEIEFSWLDEQILVPRSAVSIQLVTAATSLALTTDSHRLKFSTGDVIKVRSAGTNETIRVTGYSVTTADTLLVTRGYDGTTAAQHITGSIVIGLGTALPEGSDPEASRSQDRVSNSNYTQIFGPTSVHMSATEQVVAKYGVSNEFAHQVFNRTKENVISREAAYIYGRKTNSTTTEIRTTGGLAYFITTNQDTTSTQITITSIQANQQLTYNQGGVPDRLAVNPGSLADLNATTDTARVRQEVMDSRRGRAATMTAYTEFGAITIVRNRWVHPFDAFGFSRENVVRRILRPLVLERLAKTGDSDKAQVVAEEGLEVKGEEHAFVMSALSYTAA